MNRRRRATIPYGPGRRQVADLWLPENVRSPVPVVVLVHGGFWKARYTKRLLNRMAADVVRRGWAAWNVEYRSVGRHGGGNWPLPLLDVAAALGHVAKLEGVDVDRVAICGHSVGAQLALCAAAGRRQPAAAIPPSPAFPVGVRAAVALAGVLDLADAADRRLGGGAVTAFMGGSPDEVPDRYAAASPLDLVPLGIDQVVVHGEEDSVVPPESSQRYVKAARAAGDRVFREIVPGHGHLSMIDPGRPAWRAVAAHLDRLLR